MGFFARRNEIPKLFLFLPSRGAPPPQSENTATTKAHTLAFATHFRISLPPTVAVSLSLYFSARLEGSTTVRKMSKVGFEPTPPKRLQP